MSRDWREPYPPVVGQWRWDQVADQANWRTIGSGPEDVVDHNIGQVQRDATDLTIVNPLDPVASGMREVPPGADRKYGYRPAPAGRA